VDFVINETVKVVDNWKMYEAWTAELTPPYGPVLGALGCYFYDWVEAKKLSLDSIINLGDVVTGKIKARKSDEDIIFFGMGGMPVYDVAWSFECYKKALELGIGTKLKLWDTPSPITV
jgi:ornithine cyclodeaminase